MNIYTSYFGNWRKFPQESTQYCIARELKFPSDMEKLLLLAPKKDLLNALKADIISEEEFTDKYTEQLAALDADELGSLVDRLLLESKDKAIILSCYEKKGDFCHRHVLSDFLNKIYNLDIKEL